jgi:hypothetical protein
MRLRVLGRHEMGSGRHGGWWLASKGRIGKKHGTVMLPSPDLTREGELEVALMT